MRLQNHSVRARSTDDSPNLPQTGAPYLAILVRIRRNVRIQIFRVVLRAVQHPRIGWIAAAGGMADWKRKHRTNPSTNKNIPSGLRADAGELGPRPVVAEALAHRRAFFRRAKTGNLIVLDGMTVLMPDDHCVLGKRNRSAKQ